MKSNWIFSSYFNISKLISIMWRHQRKYFKCEPPAAMNIQFMNFCLRSVFLLSFSLLRWALIQNNQILELLILLNRAMATKVE